MHYQGHHSDGSSIQAHSVGGIYPFVIVAKQFGDGLRWGCLIPGHTEPRNYYAGANGYDRAHEVAESHIAWRKCRAHVVSEVA